VYGDPAPGSYPYFAIDPNGGHVPPHPYEDYSTGILNDSEIHPYIASNARHMRASDRENRHSLSADPSDYRQVSQPPVHDTPYWADELQPPPGLSMQPVPMQSLNRLVSAFPLSNMSLRTSDQRRDSSRYPPDQYIRLPPR